MEVFLFLHLHWSLSACWNHCPMQCKTSRHLRLCELSSIKKPISACFFTILTSFTESSSKHAFLGLNSCGITLAYVHLFRTNTSAFPKSTFIYWISMLLLGTLGWGGCCSWGNILASKNDATHGSVNGNSLLLQQATTCWTPSNNPCFPPPPTYGFYTLRLLDSFSTGVLLVIPAACGWPPSLLGSAGGRQSSARWGRVLSLTSPFSGHGQAAKPKPWGSCANSPLLVSTCEEGLSSTMWMVQAIKCCAWGGAGPCYLLLHHFSSMVVHFGGDGYF